MYISQAIYVVKENPATVNRGQKSGRVRGRDQLQHVAMLLGRTAWRHVGGAPPNRPGGAERRPTPVYTASGWGFARCHNLHPHLPRLLKLHEFKAEKGKS